MKDFLNKNKIALSVSIYLIAIGAFFYFLVIPIQKNIDSKASDIQQEKIDQDITNKKIATVPTIEKDYQKYKESEGMFNRLMEPSKEVDFIKELEKLAEETNNKVEFKIQEEKKEDAKKKEADAGIKDKLAYKSFLSMQIAIEGNYDQLINFIHKLENYKSYVNIISIRTEKITQEVEKNGAVGSDAEDKEVEKKQILNSILDIVVYKQ